MIAHIHSIGPFQVYLIGVTLQLWLIVAKNWSIMLLPCQTDLLVFASATQPQDSGEHYSEPDQGTNTEAPPSEPVPQGQYDVVTFVP